MNAKVNICGIDTNNLPTLSHAKTIELFQKMHNGDERAREELLYANLKLVLSILKRFNKDSYNMDDLFQQGVIGLLKAIDNFDLSYNLKLSTYAVPLILGEIKRHTRDDFLVRVSRGTKDLAYKIIKFQEDYLSIHGTYPDYEIISNEFNIPEYRIREVLDSLQKPVSINEPIFDDGGDTIYLEDQIKDNKDYLKDKDGLISLKKALSYVKTREKKILLERYIYGKTQVEIANNLGISQAQVSRLEKGAIKTLKRVLK